MLKSISIIFSAVFYGEEKTGPEPESVNLLRSPGIDSKPGGIDSWALLSVFRVNNVLPKTVQAPQGKPP